MGRSNTEVVKAVHEAINRGDPNGLVPLWDEEAEFRPINSALDGEVYHGHAGLRKWFGMIREQFSKFETHPHEFHDLGDRVLALGRWHAVGEASGIVLNVNTAAWLVEIRNGRVFRWRAFSNRVEAMKAAGLSSPSPAR